MEKRKRDPVVPEMRERLLANRDGRLTAGQWLDLIVQPLITLAILFALAFLVFRGSFMALIEAAWWVLLPLIVILVFLPVTLRAYRYARTPVYFARLYGSSQPLWGFWKNPVFHTDTDEQIAFAQRLAPRILPVPEREYLVYFLDEPRGKVLLSAAPADHDDAELWLPTKRFEARYRQRVGRS